MTWIHPAFESIAGLVNKRTGLAFTNRQDSAEAGIRRAMTHAHVHHLEEYLDRLAADENALEDLVNELTVGETYFFREPAQFDVIHREIIPEFARRRGPGHSLRAWSAACASGEEAYSLAILFDQLGLASQCHLVATDISRTALSKARQGLYSPWSLRGDGAPSVLPYLTQAGSRQRLHDKIRSRVAFSHLNLALDIYPSFASGVWGMDLILCRNVLVYFDPETVAKVARRLYEALADGGWIITSSTDPPLWDHAPFEVVTFPEGVFVRRPVGKQAELWPTRAAGTDIPARVEQPTMAGPADELAEEEVSATIATSDRPDPAQAEIASEGRSAAVQPSASEDAAAAAAQVRTLANLNATAAADACAKALASHPLSPELHYLHAVLLLDLGEIDNATHALRRVLYLDRTLAVAHFTLGTLLRQRGDRAGACRALRSARSLCAAGAPEEVLPLGDGETAGRLAEIAGAELRLLEAP